MADQLTAANTISEWLSHPIGGPIMREMLAAGGQDESALAPVASFSLAQVAQMSGGKMPQSQVDDMVARANGGEMPAVPVESQQAAAPGPQPWAERVTPGRFAGKTVIVTGAGSGIGRATASRIAHEGGRVIAVDVSAPRLEEVAAELPGVVTVVADITRPDAVDAVMAAAGDRVDGLANVAGVMDDFTPLHEVGDEVWARVMSVNVDGTFRLSRAVIPLMLAAGGGSIVNISSEAGLRGSAAGFAYTTSKHAVIGMTRSAAFMYAPLGIRVNAVAPGPVATNIQATFASELGQKRLGPFFGLLPPVASSAQLAASITFLLSDDATNLTGIVLPSDGGWSIQ